MRYSTHHISFKIRYKINREFSRYISCYMVCRHNRSMPQPYLQQSFFVWDAIVSYLGGPMLPPTHTIKQSKQDGTYNTLCVDATTLFATIIAIP
jgi:hypothetical protein